MTKSLDLHTGEAASILLGRGAGVAPHTISPKLLSVKSLTPPLVTSKFTAKLHYINQVDLETQKQEGR